MLRQPTRPVDGVNGDTLVVRVIYAAELHAELFHHMGRGMIILMADCT